MLHDESDRVVLSLADQLRQPLLQIARLSEVAADDSLAHIETISQHALKLVDSFVRASGQEELPLEPLTTSSLLYEVAHTVSPLARQLGCELQVDLKRGSKPVMGHRQLLKDMLYLLSTSLLQSSVPSQQNHAPRVVLGTHNAAGGAVVGAFSDAAELSERALRLNRELRGKAAQSAPALTMAGGAALAVADRLSRRLQAPLKAYRHDAMPGVGSLLIYSSQLRLI